MSACWHSVSVPTPKSSLYRLVDAAFDGRLAERIAAMREEGESYEGIAARLYAESGARVSHSSIRTWANQLGVDTDDSAPEAVAG